MIKIRQMFFFGVIITESSDYDNDGDYHGDGGDNVILITIHFDE